MGRAQLGSQVDDSKQWDTKALGVLTAIGAFGSFVFANHTSLGREWWVAWLLLGGGAVACLVTLFGRRYDLGPEIRKTYNRYGGSGDAAMPSLVAEFGASIEHNGKVSKLKSIAFAVAVGLSVSALVATGISVWLFR